MQQGHHHPHGCADVGHFEALLRVQLHEASVREARFEALLEELNGEAELGQAKVALAEAAVKESEEIIEALRDELSQERRYAERLQGRLQVQQEALQQENDRRVAAEAEVARLGEIIAKLEETAAAATAAAAAASERALEAERRLVSMEEATAAEATRRMAAATIDAPRRVPNADSDAPPRPVFSEQSVILVQSESDSEDAGHTVVVEPPSPDGAEAANDDERDAPAPAVRRPPSMVRIRLPGEVVVHTHTGDDDG